MGMTLGRGSGRALLAALAALAVVAAGATSAAAAEPLGARMSAEELRVHHEGRDLTGCYLNRPEEPVWRERMAEDGRLYDLLRGDALVGSWWVADVDSEGAICFRYTDRPPGPYCFTGRRRGAHFDFYAAGTDVLVTTTECGEEPVA
jgi:hypothetical protein